MRGSDLGGRVFGWLQLGGMGTEYTDGMRYRLRGRGERWEWSGTALWTKKDTNPPPGPVVGQPWERKQPWLGRSTGKILSRVSGRARRWENSRSGGDTGGHSNMWSRTAEGTVEDCRSCGGIGDGVRERDEGSWGDENQALFFWWWRYI